MTKKLKPRLDQILVDRGFVASKERANALILAGKVRVDGKPITKAGSSIADSSVIEVQEAKRFVGRGGEKLEGALEHFSDKLSAILKDAVVLDVGASTGGFTDCLLQKGVKHVYAVDVGYNQIDFRLRTDARVTVLERTNIRDLKILPERANLIVIDVSFISVLKFLEHLKTFLNEGGLILWLIKPQFEATREQVGKGGVIRDLDLVEKIVSSFVAQAIDRGFKCLGTVPSVILGAKGNQEYFGLFRPL